MKPAEREPVPGSILSPPARGRGLKLNLLQFGEAGVESPPARGRGLKRKSPDRGHGKTVVAPRTGAWIETMKL